MQYLDKLILLAILSAVAGLLVYLLRRVKEETVAAKQSQIRVEPPNPMTLAAPAKLAPPPDPVANVPAVVSETPPIVAVKKRRRPLRAPVPEPAPTETPIVQVLDLLKNRESLASAFLLREILAAPVSKRGSSDAKL